MLRNTPKPPWPIIFSTIIEAASIVLGVSLGAVWSKFLCFNGGRVATGRLEDRDAMI